MLKFSSYINEKSNSFYRREINYFFLVEMDCRVFFCNFLSISKMSNFKNLFFFIIAILFFQLFFRVLTYIINFLVLINYQKLFYFLF